MPRYLCKREGKDIDDDLVIGGVNVVRDLSRVWADCVVYLDGVQQRVRTVYAYKDTPVMVIRPLCGEGEDYLITLDHPKLCITYPEVGYFNTDTSVVYLQRKVTRQWKQGVHSNTLGVMIPFAEEIQTCTPVDYYRFAGVRYQDDLGWHEFLATFNMYEPEYPTYGQAMNTLARSRAMSVALSIGVALVLHPINGEIHVMYHNDSVGAIDTDNNTLVIRDEYFWLEDTLRGVITL